MAGCATVFSGRHQEVTFLSQPDGATVTVGGKILGKTPLTTTIQKDKNQELRFEKEGYKTISMSLTTRINGWFWGNILGGFSGLFSSTTDSATGSIIEYSPSQYLVTLFPDGSSPISVQPNKNYKTKEFIVMSYSKLAGEIAQGKGEYLDSLYSLLEIPSEKRGEALAKLRALSTLYTEIPTFADKVIEQFVNSK
jgi:hypothetical protein